MKLTKNRIAAALLAFATLHAHAGVFDDDEARRAIVALKAKVETMERDLVAANAKLDTKSDKSVALDMLNQHEQTMHEMAQLRGQIEELKNLVETGQKNQKILYADLDARIRKIEQPPQQQAVEDKPADVVPSDKLSFDAAQNLFRSADYTGAVRAFAEFVKRYPTSTYAPNAQYLLGNAHFMLGDYKKAIWAQDVVVKTYKDSSNAPKAMLNIASSYTALKDNKATKKTLQQLIKTFPDSPEAREAKLRLRDLK